MLEYSDNGESACEVVVGAGDGVGGGICCGYCVALDCVCMILGEILCGA